MFQVLHKVIVRIYKQSETHIVVNVNVSEV